MLLVAAVAAAYFAYHTFLGHDDRATAAYVPAGAVAYAELNTDPTSRAWLDAWMLAQRTGLSKQLSGLPSSMLDDTSAEADSWESKIKPAIGDEVAVAVWPGPKTRMNEAVIVMTKDPAKGQEAIDAYLGDQNVDHAVYQGVNYSIDENGDAAGLVDHALVLATSQAAFQDTVDAHNGGSIVGQAQFQRDSSRAASNPLVFAWMSPAALAGAYGGTDQMIAELGLSEASGAVSALSDGLGSFTLTVKANGDTLGLQMLSENRSAAFPTKPVDTRMAAQAPATSMFYLSGADLYQTVWKSLAGLTNATTLPTMSADVGDELGVNLERTLFSHLTGPYAVSGDLRRAGGSYTGEVHLTTGVDNPTAVRSGLDSIARGAMELGTPLTPQTNGYSLSEGNIYGDASVQDGVLKVTGGTRTSRATTTASNAPALADDTDYQQAMQGLPSNASVVGYVALPRLIDLLSDRITPSTYSSLQHLGAVSYALAADGQGMRADVVLQVNGK